MIRYNLEEVFFNCGHNIHRHSICCIIWPYSYYKLSVGNFSCFHLNAPGTTRLETSFNSFHFVLGLTLCFIFYLQFFSPLSKVKDEEQTGVLELMDAQNNHKYLLNLAFYRISE